MCLISIDLIWTCVDSVLQTYRLTIDIRKETGRFKSTFSSATCAVFNNVTTCDEYYDCHFQSTKGFKGT